MAVGTVTINSSGVGGTQSGTITTGAGGTAGVIMVCNDTDSRVKFDVATAGTVVLSDQSLAEKSFTRVTGLANGAQTLVSVTNSHGTSAQNAEIIYITLASA
jgi:hypothetical protein|tara:strand:+ start:3570 stop:3875 length:306 start_codon:yes stop_codon:yes gene_type:complete